MSLFISTGDVVVGNGAIDLYWGRNGRVLCCISLLGTMLIRMTLYIFTGGGVEGYVAVDLYWGRICRVVLFYRSTRNVEICSCTAVDLHWGRNGRELDDRSLLGTVW